MSKLALLTIKLLNELLDPDKLTDIEIGQAWISADQGELIIILDHIRDIHAEPNEPDEWVIIFETSTQTFAERVVDFDWDESYQLFFDPAIDELPGSQHENEVEKEELPMVELTGGAA